MTRYLSALTIILIPTICPANEKDSTAHTLCPDLSVEQFYGNYEIFHITRYRGGITSEELAKQRIGSAVTLTEEKFQTRNLVISTPSYKLKCYDLPKEGEIPTDRHSNFFGISLDRPSITVLEIFDLGDSPDEPSIKLEILNDQLWELYDGWIYKIKPSTSW